MKSPGATARNTTSQGQVGVRSGLVFTDYCYILAVAFAAFMTLDPLGHSTELPALVRHVSLMVSALAVLLTVIGTRIFSSSHDVPDMGPVVWPFVLLSALIVAGSTYARLLKGETNIFLVSGLYMCLVPLSATMLLHTRDPQAIMRTYFWILLILAIYMTLAMIPDRAIYHEREFLVMPIAVFFILGPFKPATRWFGFTFFISFSPFVFEKNTAYLIALLSLLYLLVFVWLPRLKAYSWLGRSMAVYLLFTASCAGITLITFIVLQRETYLPTGNPEYRLYTYGIAWEKFVESPLVGNFFTEPAVMKFPLYEIGLSNNILPSHSDILDVLANGGLLAFALLLLGTCQIGFLAYRHLLRPRFLGQQWSAYGHMLACMSIAGIVAYSFNPVMLQPGRSFLLWTNLGFLLGLTLLNKKEIELRSSREN